MSQQLTLASTFSILAMAALCLSTEAGTAARAAITLGAAFIGG